MLRRLISGKSLLALVLPMAFSGLALAGGADCAHEKAATATADHEMGEHCLFAKNVKKSAKMTEDGAVVTLTGKTDDAVEHIKSHFASHEKGEPCEDCPFNKEGVTSSVKVTAKGAELTLKGATPEAIKAVKEWAGKPVASCCTKHEKAA
ncbi:MAG TPA: hypothetical protein VGK94_00570 [Candidatus Polarisedimenticolia bacterium]|jgi:hypothetical protein